LVYLFFNSQKILLKSKTLTPLISALTLILTPLISGIRTAQSCFWYEIRLLEVFDTNTNLYLGIWVNYE
jgi:hypothetical protein